MGMLALLGVAPAIMLAATRLRFPGPSRAAHPEVGAAAGAAKPAGEHGIFDLLRHAVLRRVLIMSLTLVAGWDLFYFLMPIRGSELRLRPVLMTALAAAIGLFPASIATGIGSQTQQPLARVVVGGMVTAPILILLVLPALYSLVHHYVKSPSEPVGVTESERATGV